MKPTIATIQAEINAFKRRQLWWQIGFVVVVVLVGILAYTAFRGKGKPDESYLNEVRQMDSTIKWQQRQIETLKQFTLVQDTALSRLDKQYRANRPKETVIIKQYEKVPVDVRSLSREQLRREIAEY